MTYDEAAHVPSPGAPDNSHRRALIFYRIAVFLFRVRQETGNDQFKENCAHLKKKTSGDHHFKYHSPSLSTIPRDPNVLFRASARTISRLRPQPALQEREFRRGMVQGRDTSPPCRQIVNVLSFGYTTLEQALGFTDRTGVRVIRGPPEPAKAVTDYCQPSLVSPLLSRRRSTKRRTSLAAVIRSAVETLISMTSSW